MILPLDIVTGKKGNIENLENLGNLEKKESSG
jgi:hypothetical protein